MSFYGELLETGCGNEGEHTQAVSGILIGNVVENWDSEHPGMVKIEIPLGEDKKNDIGWVPVAMPYAGNEYGSFLLPEIGAHVLIAFHMGRIESPYVIGCVYDQTNALPADTAKEKNPNKTLLTKGGNKIMISDEENSEKITVQTKGGLSLMLEDESKKITLKDSSGDNSLILDTDGGNLTIKVKTKVSVKVGDKDMLTLDGNKKSVSIEADQISVKAGQKLSLKGQNTTVEGSSTKLEGQNVNVEAQAALKLKGAASLKAESSGIAQLKGSIVKLN